MRHPLDGLEDDIRDHIEGETRDNIERGMTPDEALSAALRKFGNVMRIKEETRDIWTWVWLEQLLQDIRYGFRWLRKNPGLALIMVLTLGQGIGINTAVWSVVNSVLLRPLDYPHPERLVWLADYEPFFKRDAIFLPDYFDWRAHASSYTAMAAYGYNQAALVTPKEASHITGVAIGGDFWEITGANPALGRLFRPEEQDAVVLSWELFQRQFGGDPNIVGSSVLLDGHPVTITGVLGRGFRFQFPAWWTPVRAQAAEAFVPFPPNIAQASRTGQVVALLKPGVTTQQALAELEVLERHIFEQNRGPNPRRLSTKLRVEPLQEKLVGTVRPALLVLLAAGAFVFLIATVNIANLLLARSTGREREIAIRAAVGAGRMRVIRQLFVESTIPALAGGAVGLLFAHWGIQVLVGLLPNALPRLAETGIDGSVLAFTLALSLGAGILSGTGPALSAWRTNLYDALKDGARTSSGASRARIRRVLVAGELALAMVLLTGAGLMVKSFVRMNARPPGFAPERILLVKIRLSGAQYDKKPAQESYLRELLQRLESSPGVQDVGVSVWFGFSGAIPFPSDTPPNQNHVIRINAASEKYAPAVGIRLIKGRWLKDTDPAGTAVLNESMAREAFGSVAPLGRQLSIPERVTVVGIVADLKYSQLDADPPAEVYIPYAQSSFLKSVDVVVRTDGDSAAFAPAVRKIIAGIDPTQPVYSMRTLEQELSGSIAPRRFNLFLLGTFAGSALFLAVIGIYGVSGYLVSERTREIGVRVALGAQPSQVVRMVIRDGMATASAGILAGVAAAWGLTRLMASLLYDVKPNDLATFGMVTLVLMLAGLLACWVPARMAASIDPVIALRH